MSQSNGPNGDINNTTWTDFLNSSMDFGLDYTYLGFENNNGQNNNGPNDNNPNNNLSELENNPSILTAALDADNNQGPVNWNPTLAVDSTNNQGPGYEADSEEDAVYALNDKEMPVYQNVIQTTEENGGVSALVPMEAGEPMVDDEEVTIWQRQYLQEQQVKLDKKEQNIEKFVNKIDRHKTDVEKKQAKYDDEYQKKKMGQHDLEQILESIDKSRQYMDKAKDDLDKANEELQKLKEAYAEAVNDPRAVYQKVKKSTGTKKSLKRKSKTVQAGDIDLYPDNMGGDDSLSEDERYIQNMKDIEANNKGINAKIACRRCKGGKKQCVTAPGERRCNVCKDAKKRCRYNDPLFPGYQLSKSYLSDLHEALEDRTSELAEYKKSARYSVSSSNPLSGITGYGPRSPKTAFQNYWRMVRDMEPIYGRPVEKQKRKFEIAKKIVRKPVEITEGTPSRKRQATPDDTPRTRAGKRRKPNGTNDDPIHIEDANVDSGDQGENNNTTTGNPRSPLPQTHGVSVTERQLNYAKLLMELNQPLPLDNNQLPYWPVALLPNGNLHGN